MSFLFFVVVFLSCFIIRSGYFLFFLVVFYSIPCLDPASTWFYLRSIWAQSLGPKQRQPNLHFVLKLFNLCQSPTCCRYLVVLKGYHVAFLMTSLPTIATCFLFLSFSACFAPNSSTHHHHFSYFLPMHA